MRYALKGGFLTVPARRKLIAAVILGIGFQPAAQCSNAIQPGLAT
jgi:hypothetical protein